MPKTPKILPMKEKCGVCCEICGEIISNERPHIHTQHEFEMVRNPKKYWKSVKDKLKSNTPSTEKWEDRFSKEIIDFFWNKETTIGTQRLSINHINKIKQFISNLLNIQREEVIEACKEELNNCKWGGGKEVEDGNKVIDNLKTKLEKLKNK